MLARKLSWRQRDVTRFSQGGSKFLASGPPTIVSVVFPLIDLCGTEGNIVEDELLLSILDMS